MKLNVPAKEYLAHFGAGHEEYWFRCPGGCGDHRIIVRWGASSGRSQPAWTFNGDMERPTFSPSLLVQWKNEEAKPRVCHSFIRDGQIQFLGDCTHALAGKTVPLADT